MGCVLCVVCCVLCGVVCVCVCVCLWVFRDQVVHVALGLRELHLIHTLTCVPMQEGLAAEHCCGVPGKSHRHLQALRWDVADTCLDVVGDPLHEVTGILVLDVEHLLIHLLGGHAATEQGCSCQIPSVPGVCCAHHVLGIEHLLRPC